MLTLALLRHAKSSWDDPADDDFARPLNARGLATAPLAGRALAGLGVKPSLVVCSPAKRTRETLDLALAAMGLDTQPTIMLDDRLYLASATTLIEVVRDSPKEHACVLLIGHNPGLHDTAVTLAGAGETALIETLQNRFPTAALAVLTFGRTRWRDIRTGDGRLDAFVTVKK
ncbi:MAG: histidine phosphatase family protein [Hyphomicrobium sp.]